MLLPTRALDHEGRHLCGETMTLSAKMPASIGDALQWLMDPKIPRSISSRFRHLDSEGRSRLEASLRRNYFTQGDVWHSDAAAYLRSPEGKKDLADHLHGRLDAFRSTVIPWLADAKPLANSNILEIGCGTGSSTVALAEQGAIVTAIDILETSLHVAKDRCEAYGLRADFHRANATEVHRTFANQHFDFVIFFASLEHMTLDERMQAMRGTWGMLPHGSVWCVIDTPNRLWYYDGHTSWLPFFMWLPDELSFMYSRFSPRKPFCDLYRDIGTDSKLDFLRRGRGVSFHEFELAMNRAEELDVVGSLGEFLRSQSVLRRVARALTDGNRYETFLTKIGPNIHRGFYQQRLDLIIRKS